MAEIQPFHGLFYNTRRVRLADVLTQPYDKITEEMRRRYLAASPYNLVRIELGMEEPGDDQTNNKYTRAAALFRQWLVEGILRRADQPAFYWLEQTFVPPGKLQKVTRRGLIGRVRLHRWDEGVILPHERTLSKPKVDRLALLRAVGAQQGQIFMLHPQPLPTPTLTDPLYSFVDNYNVTTTLWEITDPEQIAEIQESVAPQTLYIADGHHRYETALAYRDEVHTEASQYVMATLVDLNDPGLVILPTHRTVAGLVDFDPRKFREQLSADFQLEPPGNAGIGMADALGEVTLRPKDPLALKRFFAGKPPLWETLDVGILHVVILEGLLGIDDSKLRKEEHVGYWREPEKALEQVRTCKAQLAFFLPPTPVSAVKAVADARSRMPQKSTDFYPKLLSGMVMYEVR